MKENRMIQKNLKEADMKRARISLTALAVLIGLAGAEAWAANTPADGTITVTPLADVSLDLSPTYYVFPNAVDVNTSTDTLSLLTLSNNGEVAATVAKQITDQSTGWTA